ncbi:hypothetical protein MKX01_021968 [Papaver californicum]|nr:hypothetical protein MKX01_021968 [Papaver californicum]
MSGLTTIEKRLIDDNSHCWVIINGKGYNVGMFYESKKKDKQCMKNLLQAVRKLERDPGGSSGKSAKNINARKSSVRRPFWINLFGHSIMLWLSASTLAMALVLWRWHQ